MSARYWLLDEPIRPAYSLAQLAVLEGIIAQFPHAAGVTARDARTFADARERLRFATDDQARTNAISALVLPPKDATAEYDPTRTIALRDFLLLAESIPLSVEDIGAVLSRRDDRSMQGVRNANAVKAAIRSGQPDELATAMANFTAEERAIAPRRGADLAKDDAAKEFRASAIAALNALAPHADQRDLRDDLRQTAAETLLGSMPVLYRSLPRATVDLVFGDERRDRRLDALAVRAESEIAADPVAEPKTGLILMLVVAAARLPEGSLANARKGLAQLPDADLGPLFEPVPSPLLVPGDVANAIVSRLSRWTPATPDSEIELGAKRLTASVDAGVVGAEELDPIAVQVAGQLSGVSGPSVSGLATLAAVLAHGVPGPNIDTLAQLLATWTGDPDLGLRLAALLPFSENVHPQIANAAVNFVSSGSHAVIAKNLEVSRRALARASANVASHWRVDGSPARGWNSSS